MQWSLKQKGWRAALVKMGLLTVLWLVVAFVFATEFYLSARSGPIKVPWTVAAGSAFHDWFPWILLSPVAVVLAGRFRFARDTWRWSLIVHLAACIVFTVAYQGLLILAYPSPYILSTSGMMGITSTAEVLPPGRPSLGVVGDPGAASGTAAFGASVFGVFDGFPLPTGSNTVVIERDNFSAGVQPLPFPANSSAVFVIRTADPPPVDLEIPDVAKKIHAEFRDLPPFNRWMQVLHMAMMRTQFTVPIYLCIVCVCWVINHFQEASERERRTLELETRLTQANLQTLKMQLQPHFLFNTLNAISSLIHENPKAADDMVGSLSQFLRTTLDVSAKNEVPLRVELEFVERYLEIQQTRFGNRLQIRREVDPAVVEALVPPLILQPLVENAIRYGIEIREAAGSITIRALREEHVLLIEISDDGEGFRGGQLLTTGSGIGLSNTKARLQELYGDKHQFKLTANHPTGACVKIEIPFRLSQPETKDGP
jgi:two-component sensor histidine kinase